MSWELIKRTREPLVLTKDVKNPKPDRRYRGNNWEYYPVWLAGSTFFLVTETLKKEDGTTHETVTLEYCYHQVGLHRVPDLVAALKTSE